MKSSEFLNEDYDSLAGYYKTTDQKTGLPIGPAKPKVHNQAEYEAILDIIQTRCGKYLQSVKHTYNHIKRGMGTANFAYATIDPRTTVRKSANTNNIYTLFIDNSPKWENYPKRSQSLICATGTYASDYGNVYAIFPYDNTKIGICPTMDFWQGFNEASDYSGLEFHSLDELVRGIQTLLGHLEINNFDLRDAVFGSDFETVAKLFYRFDKEISREQLENLVVYSDSVAEKIRRLMLEKDLSLYQVLDYCLDPNANKFKVRKGATVQGALTENSQEVWIGGPVIAVSINPFDQDRYPQLRPLLHELGLGRYTTPEPKVVQPPVKAIPRSSL